MADERTPFETRLADVFERYADLAPLEIDPWVVTQAAVAAPGPGWRARLGWRTAGVDGRGWTRLILPLALVGLLIAALGAALWVGSQQDRAPLVDRGPTLPAEFVVEDVEPGVTRIVNDGVRDLSWDFHWDGGYWDVSRVSATDDGAVWIVNPDGPRPDRLFALGQPEMYALEVPDDQPDPDFLDRVTVDPDGSIVIDRWSPGPWSLANGHLIRSEGGGQDLYYLRELVPGIETLVPFTSIALETAPDGAAWVAVFGRPETSTANETNCSGLARFDGVTWTHYLRGTGVCIEQLDIARDGTVWALGHHQFVDREPEFVSEDGPVQLFVIRHDAATDTDLPSVSWTPRTPPIEARIAEFEEIESVLGPLVWTTVGGDPTTLPGIAMEPIYGSARTGYLYGDLKGIWASGDGLQWRRLALDATALSRDRGFDTVDGRWALTSGSKVLQRTNDDWNPLDLPSLSRLPVQAGDVTLIPGVLGEDDVVWIGRDGSFELVPEHDELIPEHETSALAAPTGGFVALEENGPLWTSSNGLDWVDHEAPWYRTGDAVAVRVVRQIDRLLALVDTDDGGHAIWSSVDGVDWSRETPSIRYPDAVDEVEVTDYGLISNGMVSIDFGRTWATVPATPEPTGPTWEAAQGPDRGGATLAGHAADMFFQLIGSDPDRWMTVGQFAGNGGVTP